MKRSYMVMQDVNYELFADSVEAECSFGIQGSSPELVEKTLDELGLLTVRDRQSKYSLRRAKAACSCSS